jgi:hypothetical protein
MLFIYATNKSILQDKNLKHSCMQSIRQKNEYLIHPQLLYTKANTYHLHLS